MKDRIKNYIKAGFPGLYVSSFEEARVEAVIREIVRDINAKADDDNQFTLKAWTCTEGVINITDDGKKIAETENPIEMLTHFIEGSDERTIMLARDFHPFTEDRNPLVWRKLKDALIHGKSRNKVFILLGCRICLPAELEKEMTIVEFTLPDREQLREVLHGIIDPAKGIEDEVGILSAAAGLTTTEAENAFALSIVETGKVSRDIVYREKCANVKKGGLLEVMGEKERLKLTDIGGLHALKSWLVERQGHFGDEAKAYHLAPPTGILMVGQPGCGKTETAKACGAVFGVPILRLDAGKLFGSLVGQSESNWRAAHATALAMAPCIFFIDELDGIGGTGESMDSGVTDRVVKSILQDMNDHSEGIFYIGTANDLDKLKAPLIRRFEEVFSVDLPTATEREQIWAIQLGRVKRDAANFNLTKLAAASPEFSGAEIKKLVKSGQSFAFADNRREPTTEDFVSVCKSFVPLSTTMSADLEKRRKRLQGIARSASGPAAVEPVAKPTRKLVPVGIRNVDPSNN